MKTLSLITALVLVLAGGALADIATYDVYTDWNMVSAPLVPFNPIPSDQLIGFTNDGVFDPLDIDFSGSLSRWDAPSQSMVGWSSFDPTTFGNVLLGDGYWLFQSGAGTVAYDGVPDGVPDGGGTMTDMWVSLPGNQNDAADAGGWHIIGTPFDHDVSFSKVPSSLLGDNILVTDGTTTKTREEAVIALWVNDPMTGWNGATQSEVTAGYFFPDSEYLEAGKSYWVKTNKDNLALIVPAY